jgi:RNase adaptor protein for sRNA GlmZ degradation
MYIKWPFFFGTRIRFKRLCHFIFISRETTPESRFFDVRFLNNLYYNRGLRILTVKDAAIGEYTSTNEG